MLELNINLSSIVLTLKIPIYRITTLRFKNVYAKKKMVTAFGKGEGSLEIVEGSQIVGVYKYLDVIFKMMDFILGNTIDL